MLNALLTQTTLESENVFKNGVDADNTYYILNPDANLAGTEKRLLPVFE
jgi:hypothetical protein